jgi:hypothetical protein
LELVETGPDQPPLPESPERATGFDVAEPESVDPVDPVEPEVALSERIMGIGCTHELLQLPGLPELPPGPPKLGAQTKADPESPELPELPEFPDPELPDPDFPNAPLEFDTYQVPFCFTSSPVVLPLVSQWPATHAVMRSFTSAVLGPTFETVYERFLIVTFSELRSLNDLVQAFRWLGSATAQAPDQSPFWTADANEAMTSLGEDDALDEPPHALRPTAAATATRKKPARFIAPASPDTSARAACRPRTRWNAPVLIS